MDAGLLDVLHDAGDIGVVAVGDAIDVDLDGVGEIAVDQQRPLVRHREFRRPVEIGGEPRDIAVELRAVVDDLHGAAAEHIGRPDHDRIADRRRRSRAPSPALVAMPLLRLAQLELLEQLLEAVAVLGEVDGVGRGAEDRHVGLSPAPAASLSGVWPPNCTMTPCSVPLLRSAATISSTSSAVSGSKYSRSEVS